MNTEKIKTLGHIIEAMEIVEGMRGGGNLSPEEILELEKTSITLRSLEKLIIRAKTDELIRKLTVDSKGLKELTKKIKESSEKLARIAEAIEKVTNVVEIFIKIITQSARIGL